MKHKKINTRSKKRSQKILVPKYLFDSDNNEMYELSTDEIARLEPGSGGKPKVWKNPSQFVIDQLREQLIAYGYREETLKKYAISDIVAALKQGFEKWLLNDVVAFSVRESWRKRYLQITIDSKQLEYWHEKEKNILNLLVKANNEHLKKNKNPLVENARVWLSEIWPFGKDCGRLYKLPDDLDAIYLAIGLRLDTLFRARNHVTEEMLEAIVGEWQYADELRLSNESVLFCFGPWFNGGIMSYDDPLELFWDCVETDLKEQGLVESEGQERGKRTSGKDRQSGTNQTDSQFDSTKADTGKKPIADGVDKTKMSLREFLEKRTDAEPGVIDSKIKRIKAVDKKEKILPKTANNPKGNETKLYYEIELQNIWPELKDKIPTLPNIKK